MTKPRLTLIIISLVALFVLSNTQANAEAVDKPLSVSIGTVVTELEKVALRYAIEYAENLGEKDFSYNYERSLLYFTPFIRIETGDDETLNSVIAKVTGNMLIFSTITIDDVVTINTEFFHAFPISLGLETSNRFDNINILGEIGYVPWYQGIIPKIVKKTKVGLFIQGGYKVKRTDPAVTIGIGEDESAEEPNSGLLRLKGSVGFSPEIVLDKESGIGLGLLGSADGWYDIVNNEFYYSVQATGRLILSDGKYFDTVYELGSGSPNFNQGSQFSANLTITF